MGLFITGKKRISHRFCKIHQVHEFFIANAGFYDTRAGQRLNITEIVRSVTKKGDPLAVSVNRSSSAIVSALSQALSDARKDDALYNLLLRGQCGDVFFRIRGRNAGCVRGPYYHHTARTVEHAFNREHSREVWAFVHPA
jgi:hypothetical protein